MNTLNICSEQKKYISLKTPLFRALRGGVDGVGLGGGGTGTGVLLNCSSLFSQASSLLTYLVSSIYTDRKKKRRVEFFPSYYNHVLLCLL